MFVSRKRSFSESVVEHGLNAGSAGINQMSKSVFTFLLAVALVCGLFPIDAFADESVVEDPNAGIQVEATDYSEELPEAAAEEPPITALNADVTPDSGSDAMGESVEDPASVSDGEEVLGGEFGVEDLATNSPIQRTQVAIAKFAKSHPFNTNSTASYTIEPKKTYPYTLGALSESYKNQALNALNVMRFVAGIDANVTLNSSYTQKAQAASLVNAANSYLTHRPTQPSGMSSTMYDLGAQGASKSNIARGFMNLSDSIVRGYMDDSSDYNMPTLGHRRWCLNTAMRETGFGQVGAFSAMYAFDGGAWGIPRYTNVAWPARNMPIEYWYKNEPWSLSVRRATITNKSAVKVKVTRVKDGKVWNFSSSSSNGDFHVNNDGYGDLGAIIFRPSDLVVNAGDEFKVSVSGTSAPTSYTVKFFEMSKVDTSGPDPTNGSSGSGSNPATSGVASRFPDVAQDLRRNNNSVWYVNEGWLDYVVNNGIMSGYANGNFGPYDAITRAQVATILYRSSNPASSATTDPAKYMRYGTFRDDPGGQYYTAALNWCRQESIITGYEDRPGSGTYYYFRPDKPVSREELATMLARYAAYNGANINNASSTKFYSLNGSRDVSSWARKEFIWCVDKGIISGVKTGGTSYLRPQDSAWRASMAKVITITVRDVLYHL